MPFKDLILPPFYLLFVLAVALVYLSLSPQNKKDTQIFWMGLGTKLFCGILYGLAYTFYYNGGDTFVYFGQGSQLYEYIQNDWSLAWKIFWLEANTFNIHTFEQLNQIEFYINSSTFFVVKMVAFLSLFTFNSYYSITILFAALSFSGLWALYKTLSDLYPQLRWQMAFACFLLPSLSFWGSGIMKDTITIGCFGWIIYGFYHLCIKRDQLIWPIIVISIGTYMCIMVKFYIVAALAPALAIWLVTHYNQYITDHSLRFVTYTGIGFVLFWAYWYMNHLFQALFNKILLAFISSALGFQNWHGFLAEQGGSGYSLGEIDYSSFGNIVSKAPAAINVALFRPYLFEVKNTVMLLTSLESTLFLLFTIYALLKGGLFKSFRFLLSNSVLLMLLTYVLLFAFIVGFTSYNFGALARYKIPCMPLYIAMLFILLEEKRISKISL